jgi:hypothetical protein
MIVDTPFVRLEEKSIDEFSVEVLPGHNTGQTRIFVSMTYDLISYGREWSLSYSDGTGDYNRRFIARRLGYIRDNVAFRIRVVGRDKVALANCRVVFG